jgi:putative phosphonate metabolism protein
MRAAIYFAPPADDPLTRTAAAWLGRDAFTGQVVEQPMISGLDDLAELTGFPRRYGFHATIKPPFRLVGGRQISQLEQALADFCRARQPVTTPPLQLERLGTFNALTFAAPSPQVSDLADETVRDFEVFRAPIVTDEIAQRRPENLTESQRRNLENWGYPYVFEDFRFHMTLTGPVPDDRQAAVQMALAQHFAPFIGKPIVIKALSLFVEDDPGGPFRVFSSAPLPQPTDDA